MDDAVDLLGLKQGVQRALVPDVQLIEFRLGVDGGPKTGLQIVGHHHLPARINEFVHCMGADVTGSAQYQDCHRTIALLSMMSLFLRPENRAAHRTDAQHVAAARSQHALYLLAEGRTVVQRNKRLDGSSKAAAMYTAGAATVQRALRDGQRDRHRLLAHRAGWGDVLQKLPGGAARLPHQRQEGVHVAACQCVGLSLNSLIVREEVQRAQHRAVASFSRSCGSDWSTCASSTSRSTCLPNCAATAPISCRKWEA